MKLLVLLFLVSALLTGVETKRGGGNCRGSGRHPHGRHGSGGKGKGKGEGKGDGKGDGIPSGEQAAPHAHGEGEGEGMPNGEQDAPHTHHHHEGYLEDTLPAYEDRWEMEGEVGPSTAESAHLLAACLDAVYADNATSAECETEYRWMDECLECERNEFFKPWTIGVVSTCAVICLLFTLVSCVLIRRCMRRNRSATPTVSEFEPGNKPTVTSTTSVCDLDPGAKPETPVMPCKPPLAV